MAHPLLPVGTLHDQYETSFWHDHSSPVVLPGAEFLLPGYLHKPGPDTGSSSVFKERVEGCHHGARHKLSSPRLCGVLLMVKCCDLSLLGWSHTHAYFFSSSYGIAGKPRRRLSARRAGSPERIPRCFGCVATVPGAPVLKDHQHIEPATRHHVSRQ